MVENAVSRGARGFTTLEFLQKEGARGQARMKELADMYRNAMALKREGERAVARMDDALLDPNAIRLSNFLRGAGNDTH